MTVDYVFHNNTDKDVDAIVAFPMPDISGDPEEIPAIPENQSDNFLGFEVTIDGVAGKAAAGAEGVRARHRHRRRSEGAKCAVQSVRRRGEGGTGEAAASGCRRLGQPRHHHRGHRLTTSPARRHVYTPFWQLRSTYWWRSTFPANKDVHVSHRYKPSVGGTSSVSFFYDGKFQGQYASYKTRYCMDDTFENAVRKAAKEVQTAIRSYNESRIAYILTTGGNWAAGTIGKFKLTVDKGNPRSAGPFCGDNVKKIGPTTFEMTAKDFYPEHDIDILLLEADRTSNGGDAQLMHVAIYVAIAENGVIGRDGGLPWRLSTDLKRFKADTMGKPIIMGRKTYEGIGRPLPGRLNIVVTRDKAWRAEGVEVAHSLARPRSRLPTVRGRCMAAWTRSASSAAAKSIAQALPLADRLHVTHVLAAVDGDTHFPPIDRQCGAWSAHTTSGRRKGQPRDALFGLRAPPRRDLNEKSHCRDKGRYRPKTDGAGRIALKARCGDPYRRTITGLAPQRRRLTGIHKRKDIHALEQSRAAGRRPMGRRRRQQSGALGAGTERAASGAQGSSSRSRRHHPPRPGPAAARRCRAAAAQARRCSALIALRCSSCSGLSRRLHRAARRAWRSNCGSASRSPKLSQPGLHFHWWPIETVETAKISEQQSISAAAAPAAIPA